MHQMLTKFNDHWSGHFFRLIALPHRIDDVKLATNKKNIYIFAIGKHLKING